MREKKRKGRRYPSPHHLGLDRPAQKRGEKKIKRKNHALPHRVTREKKGKEKKNRHLVKLLLIPLTERGKKKREGESSSWRIWHVEGGGEGVHQHRT